MEALFTLQDTLFYSCVLFGVCLLVCSALGGPGLVPLFPNKAACFVAFLGLEAAVGMYFPSVGCLRSK